MKLIKEFIYTISLTILVQGCIAQKVSSEGASQDILVFESYMDGPSLTSDLVNVPDYSSHYINVQEIGVDSGILLNDVDESSIEELKIIGPSGSVDYNYILIGRLSYYNPGNTRAFILLRSDSLSKKVDKAYLLAINEKAKVQSCSIVSEVYSDGGHGQVGRFAYYTYSVINPLNFFNLELSITLIEQILDATLVPLPEEKQFTQYEYSVSQEGEMFERE